LKLKFHKYKIIDMRMSEELKELIEKLPPDLQREVKDFVEFLVEKNIKRRKKGKLDREILEDL